MTYAKHMVVNEVGGLRFPSTLATAQDGLQRRDLRSNLLYKSVYDIKSATGRVEAASRFATARSTCTSHHYPVWDCMDVTVAIRHVSTVQAARRFSIYICDRNQNILFYHTSPSLPPSPLCDTKMTAQIGRSSSYVAYSLNLSQPYSHFLPLCHQRRTLTNFSGKSQARCPSNSSYLIRKAATKVTASSLVLPRRYASAIQKPAATKLLDQFNVQQKVFIVTGGGRGLGLMMAEGIAEAGGKGLCPNPLMF